MECATLGVPEEMADEQLMHAAGEAASEASWSVFANPFAALVLPPSMACCALCVSPDCGCACCRVDPQGETAGVMRDAWGWGR